MGTSPARGSVATTAERSLIDCAARLRCRGLLESPGASARLPSAANELAICSTVVEPASTFALRKSRYLSLTIWLSCSTPARASPSLSSTSLAASRSMLSDLRSVVSVLRSLMAEGLSCSDASTNLDSKLVFASPSLSSRSQASISSRSRSTPASASPSWMRTFFAAACSVASLGLRVVLAMEPPVAAATVAVRRWLLSRNASSSLSKGTCEQSKLTAPRAALL